MSMRRTKTGDVSERIKPGLDSLGDTLLIPLYGRARETVRKDPILRDEAACNIVKRLDFDFSILADKASEMSMARTTLRTAIIDRWIMETLQTQPDCVVIELGCGLNTRFSRTDNGRLLWYDLDTPEVYTLWQHFFNTHERRHFISGSAFDVHWMDRIDVPEQYRVVIIAEASVIYFSEPEVEALIGAMRSRFPEALYIFDTASQAFIDQMPGKDALKHFTARFRCAEEHCRWLRDLQLIKRINLETALQEYLEGRGVEASLEGASYTDWGRDYYLNFVKL